MGAVRLNPSIKTEDVSKEITLKTMNGNTLAFTPTYCNKSNYLFKRLVRAWPMSTWANGAVVTVALDEDWNTVVLTTNQEQLYVLVMRYYYLG